MKAMSLIQFAVTGSFCLAAGLVVAAPLQQKETQSIEYLQFADRGGHEHGGHEHSGGHEHGGRVFGGGGGGGFGAIRGGDRGFRDRGFRDHGDFGIYFGTDELFDTDYYQDEYVRCVVRVHGVWRAGYRVNGYGPCYVRIHGFLVPR